MHEGVKQVATINIMRCSFKRKGRLFDHPLPNTTYLLKLLFVCSNEHNIFVCSNEHNIYLCSFEHIFPVYVMGLISTYFYPLYVTEFTHSSYENECSWGFLLENGKYHIQNICKYGSCHMYRKVCIV